MVPCAYEAIKIGEPLKMLDILDKRSSSYWTSTRNLILTAGQWKRFGPRDTTTSDINGFVIIFGRLERMGEDTKITEAQKVPLFLATMEISSLPEGKVATLRTRNTNQLYWKADTPDFLGEWLCIKQQTNSDSKKGQEQWKSCKNCTGQNDNQNRNGNRHHHFTANPGKTAVACRFCGWNGHVEADCFSNPDFPITGCHRTQGNTTQCETKVRFKLWKEDSSSRCVA